MRPSSPPLVSGPGCRNYCPCSTSACRCRITATSTRWRDIVKALPAAGRQSGSRSKTRCLDLSPWRKGPFNVAGIEIDSEWRSDLKWAGSSDAIEPLDGRSVLDVGCGNGYYALQMRAAGADEVIGIDPTLLYVMQFIAVNTFVQDSAAHVLPLRLEETPSADGAFDTTFSMGVLYHQRSPRRSLAAVFARRCEGVVSWFSKRCISRAMSLMPARRLTAMRACAMSGCYRRLRS